MCALLSGEEKQINFVVGCFNRTFNVCSPRIYLKKTIFPFCHVISKFVVANELVLIFAESRPKTTD